jgi:hypothetical protein
LTVCTDIPEEHTTTATISNSMYLTLNCSNLNPQNKILASSNNKTTTIRLGYDILDANQ